MKSGKLIFLLKVSGWETSPKYMIFQLIGDGPFAYIIAVLHKFAKIDMHRSISVMVGKMSKIDSYQHRGSELRNTAYIIEHSENQDKNRD